MKLKKRIERRGDDRVQIQLIQRGAQLPGATPNVAAYISLVIEGGETRTAKIEVHESLRRQGIATRLYEDAARLACSRGAPLRSDSERSAADQAFWAKQERKGRAVCVRPEPEAPAAQRIDLPR